MRAAGPCCGPLPRPGPVRPNPTMAGWDAVTGALLATYPGLGSPMAITHDATRVLSNTSNTSFYLWDRATGQVLRHITPATDGFYPVAISPDGTALAAINSTGGLAL